MQTKIKYMVTFIGRKFSIFLIHISSLPMIRDYSKIERRVYLKLYSEIIFQYFYYLLFLPLSLMFVHSIFYFLNFLQSAMYFKSFYLKNGFKS